MAKTMHSATNGEIMLYGPIVSDFEVAWLADWLGDNLVVSNSSFREALNKITGDVVVRVNSPGGDVWEASGILAALIERQEAGDKISIKIDGLAASAATFTLKFDDVVASPASAIMIHKAWAFAVGNSDEIRNVAKLLDGLDENITGFYATRLGKTHAEVMEMLADETWFTAAEAKASGLIDGIVGETKPKNKHREKDDDNDMGESPGSAIFTRNLNLSTLLSGGVIR